jgi:hypothetical protein
LEYHSEELSLRAAAAKAGAAKAGAAKAGAAKAGAVKAGANSKLPYFGRDSEWFFESALLSQVAKKIDQWLRVPHPNGLI